MTGGTVGSGYAIAERFAKEGFGVVITSRSGERAAAAAEKIGKKREYVSALEKGQTDMQLSTFLRIANALGLQFSLVVG